MKTLLISVTAVALLSFSPASAQVYVGGATIGEPRFVAGVPEPHNSVQDYLGSRIAALEARVAQLEARLAGHIDARGHEVFGLSAPSTAGSAVNLATFLAAINPILQRLTALENAP